MNEYRILIVDDEDSMRLFLSSVLKREGYLVDEAVDGEDALAMLDKQLYNLVITDLKMPKVSGLQVVQKVVEKFNQTLTVVLTAHGSIENAVEAMKLGAWDYLSKPLASPDELRILVKKAQNHQQEIGNGQNSMGKLASSEEFIAQDSKMKEILRLIDVVAPTDASVLVLGESGTGKEVVAREIHRRSERKNQPFVAVNCAALAENLMESELFGHEKGAFTGAAATKPGRFEMADGGTLFLDEIGEIKPQVQVKLLRVLQERCFERVGGTKTIKVDIRIIAATNRDLQQAVREQEFREDLFYRLSVFPMMLPPLRERKGDIVPIAEYLLTRAGRHNGKQIMGISDDAQRVLLSYNWPGNVRELANVMERAAIMCQPYQKISADNLGLYLPSYVQPEDDTGLIRKTERELIIQALAEVKGNRKKAAEKLGISLRSLYYRLKEYDIS